MEFGFVLCHHTSAVTDPRNTPRADPMLLLGRLDGRLHSSPCADIFLARARLEGAATLAGLAGVPVAVRDLQNWIAGRTPPPRASEGLNDPVSLAAVFHLALSRDEHSRDPVLRATLNVLRSVLDDRAAAEIWGGDDLAYFGPLWRTVREAADRPFERGGVDAVAQRVFEIAVMTHAAPPGGSQVVTADGRTLVLPPRSRERNWLIAAAVPAMLHHADLTLRVIPSLILLPKFLPASPEALAVTMEAALGQIAAAGLRDLDRIERQAANILETMAVTRRSRAPLLARLQLAYPGLRPKAVARLLEVTPQGARKLLADERQGQRPNGLRPSADRELRG